jgi:hypothetical protein
VVSKFPKAGPFRTNLAASTAQNAPICRLGPRVNPDLTNPAATHDSSIPPIDDKYQGEHGSRCRTWIPELLTARSEPAVAEKATCGRGGKTEVSTRRARIGGGLHGVGRTYLGRSGGGHGWLMDGLTEGEEGGVLIWGRKGGGGGFIGRRRSESE